MGSRCATPYPTLLSHNTHRYDTQSVQGQYEYLYLTFDSMVGAQYPQLCTQDEEECSKLSWK